MILGIPSKADFDNNGIAYLNLAWRSVMAISLGLPDPPVEEWGGTRRGGGSPVGGIRRELLAGRAAGAGDGRCTRPAGHRVPSEGQDRGDQPLPADRGDPGDWPSGCDRVDIPFAYFKSIDAQDLIRAHDTDCSPRL